MERDTGSVRDTYDEIAGHFAKTRAYPWPEVESFLGEGTDGESESEQEQAREPEAALGLDLGCGNGRHAALLADRCGTVVGLDLSRGLLATARERARERGYNDRLALVQAEAAELPLAPDVVDIGLYVATLHHLPSRDQRLDSLDELARVLAPGGRALVSVWATTHDRFDATDDVQQGFDTTVDWTLPDGETVPRFYHIYAPAEFRADLATSALAVDRTFEASGNCYAVVRG